jgi:hypothetical protein
MITLLLVANCHRIGDDTFHCARCGATFDPGFPAGTLVGLDCPGEPMETPPPPKKRKARS